MVLDANIQNLKNILEPNSNIIEDLVRLGLLKNYEKNAKSLNILEVYDFLGLENFINFLSLFEGETIKVPTFKEFSNIIKICMCAYLKQTQNMTWEEIEQIINLEDLIPKKLGKYIQKFQLFLDDVELRTKINLKNS